jgi:hypothetical protein
MDWTERFFHYMSKTWKNLELEEARGERSGEEELSSHHKSGGEDKSSGEAQSGVRPPRADNIYTRSLAVYAARERAKWNQMAVRAHAAFSAIRLKHGIEQ